MPSSHSKLTGDQRVQRSRDQLRVALAELANEHGYDAVTVGDIAVRATVNRATFYRHYTDKEHLAVDVLAHAIEVGPTDPTVDRSEPIDFAVRIESGARLFEHFAQHARMYQPLLGYPRNRRFMISAREILGGLIQRQIDGMGPSASPPRIPHEVVVPFVVELLLGVVAWWLERGMRYPPEQMATWFIDFVYSGYLDVLGLDESTPPASSDHAG